MAEQATTERPRETVREMYQRQISEAREPTSRIQELRGQVQERQYREGIKSRDENGRTAEYGMTERPRETVREMYQRQISKAQERPPVAQERSRETIRDLQQRQMARVQELAPAGHERETIRDLQRKQMETAERPPVAQERSRDRGYSR